MTETAPIALMQAQTLPEPTGSDVPDWIHLLPAGAEIRTADNRGPYRLEDPSAVVIAAQGARLPIDENHAIDWAAPRGEPSPARGYIVELQARDDGIWGRVDWTAAGRALIADRAYLGISPAIVHDRARRIVGIVRASLTNKPNLRGLTALHMEDGMSLTAIAMALGLAEDASEAAILDGISRIRPAEDQATALQSQIGEIGLALGLTTDAAPEAVLAAARARSDAPGGVETALQAEINALATELRDIRSGAAREKAEAFVDRAIAEMRPGVKVQRDRWITLHMADPAATEAQITAIPALGRSGEVPARPPVDDKGEIALQSEHRTAARLLGVDAKTYAETLKSERLNEEML